jgi:hypothetical protein
VRGGRDILVHSTKNASPGGQSHPEENERLSQPQGPLFTRQFRNSYIFKGIQKSLSSPALSHAEGKGPDTIADGGYEGVREAGNAAGLR